MSIYGVLTGKSFADIEREFDGRGYGEFKQAVAQTVVDALRPFSRNMPACWRTGATWTACWPRVLCARGP